jgi:hypothetical protein
MNEEFERICKKEFVAHLRICPEFACRQKNNHKRPQDNLL